jgi:hypothetical protein
MNPKPDIGFVCDLDCWVSLYYLVAPVVLLGRVAVVALRPTNGSKCRVKGNMNLLYSV